jgi:hypothetical protein
VRREAGAPARQTGNGFFSRESPVLGKVQLTKKANLLRIEEVFIRKRFAGPLAEERFHEYES